MVKMTNFCSDCDLNKFWQFILEQSIQVELGMMLMVVLMAIQDMAMVMIVKF